MLVNGQDAGSDDDTDDDEAEGGGAEAQKLGKHLTGDGGVDYVMFEDWKVLVGISKETSYVQRTGRERGQNLLLFDLQFF